MKKKNPFSIKFVCRLIIALLCACNPTLQLSWVSNNNSCPNTGFIVEIDEQQQEEKINEAELDCLTQIYNTQETGTMLFYFLVRCAQCKTSTTFSKKFCRKFKNLQNTFFCISYLCPIF